MIINSEQDSTGTYQPTNFVDEPESEGRTVAAEKRPMTPEQVNVSVAMVGKFILDQITMKRDPNKPAYEKVSEKSQAFQTAMALLKPLYRPCDYDGPADLDTKVKLQIQIQATDSKESETFAEETRDAQRRNKAPLKQDAYISLDDYLTLAREHHDSIDEAKHPKDKRACEITIEFIESMAKAAGMARG